jgi:hypothetical protein
MKSRFVPSVGILALLFFQALETYAGATPVFRDPAVPLEQRVENLLQQLTLEEKAGLCSGFFRSGGVPRLGIGTLATLDGRQGVRPLDKKPSATTLLPCALAHRRPDRHQRHQASGPVNQTAISREFQGLEKGHAQSPNGWK